MVTPTPECDKALEIKPYAQKIGEFVEWLRDERGVVLARWEKLTEESPWTGRERTVEMMCPADESIERLLAGFFGLDLDAMEREKRAMLAELAGA